MVLIRVVVSPQAHCGFAFFISCVGKLINESMYLSMLCPSDFDLNGFSRLLVLGLCGVCGGLCAHGTGSLSIKRFYRWSGYLNGALRVLDFGILRFVSIP